mgnify:CR=1 FL=1
MTTPVLCRVNINGRNCRLLSDRPASYEAIVYAANPNRDVNTLFSVTYSGARSGSLSPGESVEVTEGMVFNVFDTGNA